MNIIGENAASHSRCHFISCCELQWNFNWYSNIFIHENVNENVVCEMASILYRPQCDNITLTKQRTPKPCTYVMWYNALLKTLYNSKTRATVKCLHFLMLWHWRVGCYCHVVTSEWAPWRRLKSPASRWFAQPFVQVQIKENIKAPRHRPFWRDFTGDRWIPLTKGQLGGNVDDVIMHDDKIHWSPFCITYLLSIYFALQNQLLFS